MADVPTPDRLLYGGEEVVARVGRADQEVVVTTHRLLALAPDGEGANLRAVHRPNVEDVRTASTGRGHLAGIGARALLLGSVAVAVSALVDFSAMAGAIPVPEASGVSAGGILAVLETVRSLVALVGPALLGVGAASLLGGAIALGLYWQSRERALVVAVAGGDDVHLEGGDFGEADVAAVTDALSR
ncbi:MAG: hypothetical protein ABEJ77_00190 [Halanaeroarchaeum sp.]